MACFCQKKGVNLPPFGAKNLPMSKRVILELSGENRVFRDLTEASEALGLNRCTVSRKISEGRGLRYVQRVFKVRVDGDVFWEWVPCVYNSRKKVYERMDGKGVLEKPKYEWWVKEATSEFYCGTQFASGNGLNSKI